MKQKNQENPESSQNVKKSKIKTKTPKKNTAKATINVEKSKEAKNAEMAKNPKQPKKTKKPNNQNYPKKAKKTIKAETTK